MNEDKPKRRYNSGRRTAQAAENRSSVLRAARRMFIEAGWQGATIASIAGEAGVSAEMIYSVFGSKRALLERLVSEAVRGASSEVPLLEQAGPQGVKSAKTQSGQLALFSGDISTVLSRVAPLVNVVRIAGDSDPEMAKLYKGLHKGRRHNLEFVVDALLANGPLKQGLDRNEAVAIVWRLASPELFLLLTSVEGLSSARYADWLERALAAQLLDQAE